MKSYKGLIRPGDYIKHKQHMDVAIYVTGVGCLEVGGSSIQIAGIWWNMGFEKSWCINEFAHFSIDADKLVNWELCVNPEKNQCLRKCEWTPLAYEEKNETT